MPGPSVHAIRTIRIDVQYEGTEFVGWQRQKNGTAVQELVEHALTKVANEEVTLFGASRTDAGVHARQQVASFSLTISRTPVEAFVDGANALLPADIRVMAAAEADLRFHAGRDSIGKTYRYFFAFGKRPLVYLRRYAWNLRKIPDLEKMERAAEELVGVHDFSAFQTSGSDVRTTGRTVHRIRWDRGEMDLYYLEITADGFLKQMVRNIVGTVVEIGQGKRPPDDIRAILVSRDRKRCGATAPAHGLFLWNVHYESLPPCQPGPDLE